MMLSPIGVCARQSLGIGILLAFAATASHAQDGRWYVGGGVGALNANADTSKFAQPNLGCAMPLSLNCTTSVDDDSVSVSGFGGYGFNDYVALEAGYADLPDSYNVRVTNPNTAVAPTFVDVQQDSEAFFLRGVFTLPLRDLDLSPALANFSVSAVLGVSYWRSDTDLVVDLSALRGPVTGAPVGFRSTASHSASGTSFTPGARVNYDFSKAIRVSAAWDRYQDLGNANAALRPPLAIGGVSTVTPVVPAPLNSVDDYVDVFSINVAYRF